MGLYTGCFEAVKIIDRTLPEILRRNAGLEGHEITKLLYMLKMLGADILEINSDTLKRICRLPMGMEYLYRIDSAEDLEELSSHNAKKVILGYDVTEFNELLGASALCGKDITIEFRVEAVDDLDELKELMQEDFARRIDTIRILGLNSPASSSWLELIESIRSSFFVNIDICPENTFSNAVSMAIDSMITTADYITASFAGCGGASGYAAIEQILVFIKTMIDPDFDAELHTLPLLAKTFSEYAGIDIPANMPATGTDIFRYESGIHADGISKDPSTYEPYDPAVVGQRRKLVIGKHSGRWSVISKLQDFGIRVENDQAASLLKLIREKSISVHRELEDYEILELLVTDKAAGI